LLTGPQFSRLLDYEQTILIQGGSSHHFDVTQNEDWKPGTSALIRCQTKSSISWGHVAQRWMLGKDQWLRSLQALDPGVLAASRLLTNSSTFTIQEKVLSARDLEHERSLQESLQMLGIPIYVDPLSKFTCPFRQFFRSEVCAPELQQLAGNGVHITCIGACLVWLFSSYSLVEPSVVQLPIEILDSPEAEEQVD
jgi:hypothetical protein